MDSLRTAADARDAAALCQTAHRLRGAAANVGAIALAALAADLEALGAAGNTGSAPSLVLRAAAEIERTEHALRAEVEAPQ